MKQMLCSLSIIFLLSLSGCIAKPEKQKVEDFNNLTNAHIDLKQDGSVQLVKEYTKKEVEKQIFVNEIFAVVIGLILLYGLKKERRKINKGAFYRLLTSLRYNSMSPNSVALIYEYLYE